MEASTNTFTKVMNVHNEPNARLTMATRRQIWRRRSPGRD